MTDISPTPNSPTKNADSQTKPVTPLRCFTGALIAGSIGIAAYYLMLSISHTFATHPIHSDNQIVINLGAAVRTLVVGIVALASGVFAFAATGLTALGFQLFIQSFSKKPETPSGV